MGNLSPLNISDRYQYMLVITSSVSYGEARRLIINAIRRCRVVRRSWGVIIAFSVSLVISALMGPSPAAAHMNHMKIDAAHTHSAVSHHQTPDHSQNDAKADGACCMLACVPVIMNERPPAQIRLRVTERIAPLFARLTVMYRGEPPFHPPRRA